MTTTDIVRLVPAAERLGMSRATAYRRAKDGIELAPGVPIIRLGGRLVVAKADLERVLGINTEQAS